MTNYNIVFFFGYSVCRKWHHWKEKRERRCNGTLCMKRFRPSHFFLFFQLERNLLCLVNMFTREESRIGHGDDVDLTFPPTAIPLANCKSTFVYEGSAILNITSNSFFLSIFLYMLDHTKWNNPIHKKKHVVVVSFLY